MYSMYVSCDIHPHTMFVIFIPRPYPCPENLCKLHTVPICYLNVFYRLAWARAWI